MTIRNPMPKISVFNALGYAARQDLVGLMRCHEDDSDIFGWRVGGRRYVVVRNPDYVEHILVGGYEGYPKSEQYELLKTVLGIGLFTDEGESWARHRKMIQPLMSRRHLTGLVDLMLPPIEEFAAAWEARPDGDELDVSAAMVELTLEVVGRALMGQGFGQVANEIRPAVVEGVESGVYAAQLQVAVGARRRLVALAARILHDVPMVVPRLRNIQWMMRTIDRVIYDVIRDHEENPHDEGDLVSLLLNARDDDGQPMPRKRIRDELATFMLAGHETTANGLAWMWLLLAEHPDARARMLDEVDNVLGGRPPTAADAERLPWTSACFQEALRLYPPAWIMPRKAAVDDVIGGHRIRKGTTVWIPIYLLQRDARWWPDPDSFDPARFLPERAKEHRRGAYLPFGAGRRMCIGASFALMEATLITAVISQGLTLVDVPGQVVVPKATITLRPSGAVPMRLQHRQGCDGAGGAPASSKKRSSA